MSSELVARVAAPASTVPLTRASVAVIMPVARDDERFRRALAAVAVADPFADELILVCDGPVPSAATLAREIGARVIECSTRRGPAAARNAGASAARSEILLFVDADVEIAPGLIERVREAFEHSDIDAVFGCYDAEPPEPNFFSQYKNLLQRFVHLHARREGSTFWGACGAIRRDVFLALDGFDERYDTPSVEDIELGYRLRNAGGRIRVRPDLAVTHLKRWTFGTLLWSDVFRRAIPWTWLLMRESALEPDLNLRYSSRAAGALTIVLVLALSAAAAFDARTLGVALLAAIGLVTIDRRLWSFFRAHRGRGFAVRALVWHWVYYFYSTTALAAAMLAYPILGRRRVRLEGARGLSDQFRGGRPTEIVSRS